MCSDRCRLMVQVLCGYRGLAGSLARRILVLLLWGLVAGYGSMRAHTFGGV
jgi:hypothetical protein